MQGMVNRLKKIKRLWAKYLGVEIVIGAIFLKVISDGNLVDGPSISMTYLFVAYLVLKLFYKLEGRFSIAIALVFLGLTGIFLGANDEAKANSAAEIAFIFLVIGVLWQIAELVAERREQA